MILKDFFETDEKFEDFLTIYNKTLPITFRIDPNLMNSDKILNKILNF